MREIFYVVGKVLRLDRSRPIAQISKNFCEQETRSSEGEQQKRLIKMREGIGAVVRDDKAIDR
jgi:hypothetical protein